MEEVATRTDISGKRCLVVSSVPSRAEAPSFRVSWILFVGSAPAFVVGIVSTAPHKRINRRPMDPAGLCKRAWEQMRGS